MDQKQDASYIEYVAILLAILNRTFITTPMWVSHQGPYFINEMGKHMVTVLGIRQRLTGAYYFGSTKLMKMKCNINEQPGEHCFVNFKFLLNNGLGKSRLGSTLRTKPHCAKMVKKVYFCVYFRFRSEFVLGETL